MRARTNAGVEIEVVPNDGKAQVMVIMAGGHNVVLQGDDVYKTAHIALVNSGRSATYWSEDSLQKFPDGEVQRIETTSAAYETGAYLALVFAGLGDLLGVYQEMDLGCFHIRFQQMRNNRDFAAFLRSMCADRRAPIRAMPE